MKIRLTIMTENDKPRPEELTEDKVKAMWQAVLNVMCLMSDSGDSATIESVEFVEDGGQNDAERISTEDPCQDYLAMEGGKNE